VAGLLQPSRITQNSFPSVNSKFCPLPFVFPRLLFVSFRGKTPHNQCNLWLKGQCKKNFKKFTYSIDNNLQLDVLYTKEGWVEAVEVYLLLVLFMLFDKLTVKPICPVRMFLTGVSSESAARAMDTPYRNEL